jgi:hypothetical protein
MTLIIANRFPQEIVEYTFTPLDNNTEQCRPSSFSNDLNTLSDEPDIFLSIIPFQAATGRIMRNLGLRFFVLLVQFD